MSNIFKKTIIELAELLAIKAISSKELTEIYLNRIEKYDAELNSFITVDKDRALAQAQAADKILAKNQGSVLTGIPMAHKDIFCTQDIKTSCGSKMLDNFIAPYDATIVEKLNKSGMVCVGKTNMDEFAMGSSNETSYYGPTKNPWDLNCVPGGSSGGSAAAVAARLIPFASGTDTGGSIRQPAAFCGITGIKPTYGRISRYGMIAFASSLDQGGPITLSAADAAVILEAMCGYDPKDSTSLKQPVPKFSQFLNQSIKNLTIGLPEEFFQENLPKYSQNLIEQAIAELKSQGVNFKEISLANSLAAIPAYYIIAPAECSSNLARYDGIRYGYRCKNPKDLIDLYKRTRAEGFGEEVKNRILVGTYVLSAGYYDAYYIKAQKVRTIISEEFKQAFQDVDAILGPTTPNTAFAIGEKTQDPISMYLNDIYTSAVNLAGLPAISIPCGFSNNLPVGLQIIGNYLDEAKILNIAHQYQQATDWHQRLPSNF